MRIHHRLVKIHAFVNGNGRHARLVSDIYLYNNDNPLPNWPRRKLIEQGDIRNKYIAALKDADRGNFATLEKFTADVLDTNLGGKSCSN